MGIKLQELHAACDRYERFKDAAGAADPKVVASERLRLGVLNATRFTSNADRLGVLANAVLSAPLPAGGDNDGGALAIAPPLLDLATASREVIFAENDLRPIRYLHVALLAARAVGKLTVRGMVDEEGDATGFLVAPGVLLTNHHVLPDPTFASVSYVSFDFEDDIDGRPRAPKLFDLLPRVLYVSDKELDYCFVAVAPQTAQGDSLSQFGYLRMFEETGKIDPNRRQAANIVQHPLGQGKKLVVRDNYFSEPPKDTFDAARVQNSLFYGADTLKGSSGSPVCTDEWFVVALHRGGVPTLKTVKGKPTVIRRDGTPARDGDAKASIAYVTNEGTRVSRIYGSLRQKVADATLDASMATQALQRMKDVASDTRLGPVDRSTAPLPVPTAPRLEEGAVEERLTRRSLESLAGLTGYDPAFLGQSFKVGLPEFGSEAKREVSELLDGSGHHLHYLHYTVAMHAQRRTAFYAACNIDGNEHWKVVNPGVPLGSRPSSWFVDPRIEEAHQPDDLIFSQAMQRGHLFKREDTPWGGDDDTRREGERQSFMITNATPMIANFNNVEWGDLEDLVTKHLLARERVTYFAGPIFDVQDRYFNQLKAGVPKSQRRRGMRVPSCFWKIVAWVEGGSLRSAGFVLDQSDEIRAHGPITEEISFGSYEQTTIEDIQDRTGLRFNDLLAADTA